MQGFVLFVLTPADARMSCKHVQADVEIDEVYSQVTLEPPNPARQQGLMACGLRCRVSDSCRFC